MKSIARSGLVKPGPNRARDAHRRSLPPIFGYYPGWMSRRSFVFAAFAPCLLLGCLKSAPEANLSKESRPAKAAPFSWPHAARAAVSLTYDDAIASQLDNAAPALKRHGLLATFFLTGSSPTLEAAPERYRELVKVGHELGAHTIYHPCDRALGFPAPGFALQDYDQARMAAELEESVRLLRALGQGAPFSFAYPCGSTWLGEARVSYVPLVEKLFLAARGVRPQIADPTQVSLSEVPSAMGNGQAGELISWVDRALADGGWLVVTFHGVAGGRDNLAVSAEAHEALLSYLEQHRNSVWTERFGTVAAYVRAARKP
jgi:peptidoglycan/xylan/chitin deacetylase (PgdA/CDA1 family)